MKIWPSVTIVSNNQNSSETDVTFSTSTNTKRIKKTFSLKRLSKNSHHWPKHTKNDQQWWKSAFPGSQPVYKLETQINPELMNQVQQLWQTKQEQYKTKYIQLSDQDIFNWLGEKPLDSEILAVLRQAKDQGWLGPLACRWLDYPNFKFDLEQLIQKHNVLSTDDLAAIWTKSRAFRSLTLDEKYFLSQMIQAGHFGPAQPESPARHAAQLILNAGVLYALPDALPNAPAPRPPLVVPLANRPLFAVGDIHGNLPTIIKNMTAAGLISFDENHEIKWTGGNAILVQTGDRIDRGDQDDETLKFFNDLIDKAHQAGGMVVTLLGNHEIMNLTGHFSSSKDVEGFEEYVPNSHRKGLAARQAAFGSKGLLRTKILSRNPLVQIIGETVFVHAGLPNQIRINRVQSNQQIPPGISALSLEILSHLNDEIAFNLEQGKLPTWLAGIPSSETSADPRQLFWTRRYGGTLDDKTVALLPDLLGKLASNKLVIGHTPQVGEVISCEGRLVKVDVSFIGPKPFVIK